MEAWHPPRAAAIRAAGHRENGIRVNAQCEGESLDPAVPLDEGSRGSPTLSVEKFHLSARGHHRVPRAARTLADLESGGPVHQIQLAEALTHRRIQPGRS